MRSGHGHEPSYKLCFEVVWFDLLEWEIREMCLREMRLCEKRKGDRIKSGGCAKFACLFKKQILPNWPMLVQCWAADSHWDLVK